MTDPKPARPKRRPKRGYNADGSPKPRRARDRSKAGLAARAEQKRQKGEEEILSAMEGAAGPSSLTPEDTAELAELAVDDAVQVRGKIRAVLEAMVFRGLTARDAAVANGMAPKIVWQMLSRPRYRRAYDDMLEVLRASTRARNIHRLTEIRDESKNHNAAVSAIKVLERITETAPTVNVNISPGYVLDLSALDRRPRGQMIEHQQVIEPNPLIQHAAVPRSAPGTPEDDA